MSTTRNKRFSLVATVEFERGRTLGGKAVMTRGLAFLSPKEWLFLATLMAVVSSITAAERTRAIPLWDLASSPHAVAEARLWSLVTSALLVSSPLFWSLLSLAVFCALTLRFCGVRVLLISAFAGHVASALVVYALLTVARAFDPRAFEAVVNAPDFGVSAVSAAWLGAMASVGWRGGNGTLWRKIATVLAVVAVAAFGWIVRGHLNFLDLEHVVAFAIGVVLAVGLSRHGSATRVESEAVATSG
jgi:hypothetical protein